MPAKKKVATKMAAKEMKKTKGGAGASMAAPAGESLRGKRRQDYSQLLWAARLTPPAFASTLGDAQPRLNQALDDREDQGGGDAEHQHPIGRLERS
jgi:hypothetical protein